MVRLEAKSGSLERQGLGSSGMGESFFGAQLVDEEPSRSDRKAVEFCQPLALERRASPH